MYPSILKCSNVSVNRQEFCNLFLKAVILLRLPQGAYFQLSGTLVSYVELSHLLISHLNLTGTPLSLKDVALKPKPSKSIQMPVDQYMSTFLFDIASNYKDIPKYLDSLLLSKKRKKQTVCNEQPNKAQKLSRRQKKKLKQASTDTTMSTHKPSSQIVTIDRAQLFYCSNVVDSSTGNGTMNLPKDSKQFCLYL